MGQGRVVTQFFKPLTRCVYSQRMNKFLINEINLCINNSNNFFMREHNVDLQ